MRTVRFLPLKDGGIFVTGAGCECLPPCCSRSLERADPGFPGALSHCRVYRSQLPCVQLSATRDSVQVISGGLHLYTRSCWAPDLM